MIIRINMKNYKRFNPINQSYRRMTNLSNIYSINNIKININQDKPILKSLATQKNITHTGVISGGWLIDKMDIAGGIHAWDITNGCIYTIACDKLQFHKSVHTGDLVSFYTKLTKTKTTSLQIYVEAIIRQPPEIETYTVSTGMFTYVAVDKNGKPRNYKKKIIP